ncbi:MAG: FAD-dependent oxidoreductase [Planctomycetes bacterium]|nr:FAD-dependent oxidoreductase [Planctomycetota bacterium]
MRRRDFLASCGVLAASAWTRVRCAAEEDRAGGELAACVVIVGGGLGGCAAALAAARMGARVVLSEPTDWIGGQLTQQAVPPDENRWIESFGCTGSYRRFRNLVRDYYRTHYPLTDAARAAENLNPGNGSVSRLCHEPRVALAVLEAMLAPAMSSGRLTLLLNSEPVRAEVERDRIRAVVLKNVLDGRERVVTGAYFIDASELGDLLPLTGAEYVTGAESQQETGEAHAPAEAEAGNIQAFTWCFAMDYLEGEDHTIEKPARYDFWRRYVPELSPPWPGRLLDFTYTHPPTLKPRELSFAPTVAGRPDPQTPTLNLWKYRRIIDRQNFEAGHYPSDITIVNWPQNDYLLGSIFDVSGEERRRHLEGAKQLSLSLLYWLQTEAPRPDGKEGWPGLRLRKDVVGTSDGLAKFPYVRESRRIRAEFTVLQQHVWPPARSEATGRPPGEVTAAPFDDSVGVGHYVLDLHPSTGGDNYIDLPCLPFQIPLGALIPRRMENLLAGCKNLGTTHITNGCYRLHPVEWNIGEAAGALAAHCLKQNEPPRRIRNHAPLLNDFQSLLVKQGFELDWSKLRT